MLDRISVIGIRIPNIRRMKDDERNPIMKAKVEALVQKLRDPEMNYNVAFVRHLNRQARNPDKTVLEVRFGSSEQANSIRQNFVKKRNDAEFEDINITPTVRLATRVRIEILLAIIKVLKNQDSTISKAQCLQYVAKPILKIFRKDEHGNEFSRVMTFIDAVLYVKENSLEHHLDLQRAYQRAGSAFRGTMSQHFVLMA
jgi:hypothetical protein